MGVGSSDQPDLTVVCDMQLLFAQLFAARRLKLDGLAVSHDHAQLAVIHAAQRFDDPSFRVGQAQLCLVLFHGGHLLSAPVAAQAQKNRAGIPTPRGKRRRNCVASAAVTAQAQGSPQRI